MVAASGVQPAARHNGMGGAGPACKAVEGEKAGGGLLLGRQSLSGARVVSSGNVLSKFPAAERQPGSKEKPTEHVVKVRLHANKLQDTSMWGPTTKPTEACEGPGSAGGSDGHERRKFSSPKSPRHTNHQKVSAPQERGPHSVLNP